MHYDDHPEESVEIINFTEVSEQLHTVNDYVRFGASRFNQADLYFATVQTTRGMKHLR